MQFFNTKQLATFRNFRVISKKFRFSNVILCGVYNVFMQGFEYLYPPYAPLSMGGWWNDPQITVNCWSFNSQQLEKNSVNENISWISQWLNASGFMPYSANQDFHLSNDREKNMPFVLFYVYKYFSTQVSIIIVPQQSERFTFFYTCNNITLSTYIISCLS